MTPGEALDAEPAAAEEAVGFDGPEDIM